MNDIKSVAYDAFITQLDRNLETAGPSTELEVSVLSGDVQQVFEAARQMCKDAAGKAKLLWTGSPVGTILRNAALGASAQRAISPDGIPLWNVSDNEGNRWDSHEPVLRPEVDWTCIYDPTAQG